VVTRAKTCRRRDAEFRMRVCRLRAPSDLAVSGLLVARTKALKSILPSSLIPLHRKSLVDPDVDGDDDSSANKKNERLEMIERSMIVSEVAMKLEEFAKKAMKGRGGTSRTRRGAAGIVTPPWGSSHNSMITTRGLISYDDEEESDGKNTSGVVSDGDESLNSEDVAFSGPDSKESNLIKELRVAPVSDDETAKLIVSEIRKRASFNFYNAEMIHAVANVAEFFMSTAPGEAVEVCCSKIRQLLSSSVRLAADFHFYRAALHPDSAGDSGPAFRPRFEHHHADALRRSLEGGASRLDALHEFKIYAVNLIYRLLGKNGGFGIQQPFTEPHYANLLFTAEAWSKSVGAVA
jgi:hypothetical protein